MYRTILKKFSEDGIFLNDEQDNFLKIFEKNLPKKSFFYGFPGKLTNRTSAGGCPSRR